MNITIATANKIRIIPIMMFQALLLKASSFTGWTIKRIPATRRVIALNIKTAKVSWRGRIMKSIM